MRIPALILLLLLTACSGTALDYTGPLCGGVQPSTVQLADRKDRAGFEARCTHTVYRLDGSIESISEVVITSSESSASAVMQAQSESISNLVDALRTRTEQGNGSN